MTPEEFRTKITSDIQNEIRLIAVEPEDVWGILATVLLAREQGRHVGPDEHRYAVVLYDELEALDYHYGRDRGALTEDIRNQITNEVITQFTARTYQQKGRNKWGNLEGVEACMARE